MKPLNNRHRIKSLLFDIIFDDERRSQELYDDIRRLHYRELEDVICRCLDEYVGPKNFAQMDQLTIDLGQIHYRNINAQFTQKVYDVLSEKLKELFNSPNKEKGRHHSMAASHLDLIKHFLENGFLPWNTKESIPAILASCLKNEPQAFAKTLRDIGRQEKVRRRIIARFSSPEITQIIQVLSPSDLSIILQFRKQLTQLIKTQSVINSGMVKIEKEVWLFILNFMLLRPKTEGQISLLIKDTLIQFSEKFQLSFSKLLILLQDKLSDSNDIYQAKLRSSIQEITNNLNIQSFKSINKRQEFASLPFAEKTEILLGLIFQKTSIQHQARIKTSDLERHLMELLELDPTRVIDCLKSTENVSTLLRHMNGISSFRPFLALVRHIEPSHYKTIIDYQQNLVQIHQKAPIAAVATQTYSDNIWQIIIHISINKSGSYFNQLAFLENLIGQLSAHYNIDYSVFIEHLYKLGSTIPGASSKTSVFIQLLSELYTRQKKHTDAVHQTTQTELPAPEKSFIPKNTNFSKKDEPLEALFIAQNPQTLIQYYLQKKTPALSLSIVRGQILKVLATAADWLVTTIKRQPGYKTTVARLVHDFDEIIIQKLITAIEPTHYQTIINYQKATIVAQKKQQVVPVSIIELSDTLWHIILQMLLAPSSSKFNEKNFLKNLIQQTAAHYNVKYAALVDELSSVNVIDNLKTNNFHSFIQLILEIQSVEKDKIPGQQERLQTAIKKTNKTAHKSVHNLALSPSDRLPDALIEFVIGASSEGETALKERGFKNIEEAIQFLVSYQEKALLKTLKKANIDVLQNFIAQLPTKAMELLMRANQTQFSVRIQVFLRSLNRRLYDYGFQQRLPLMQNVRNKCLVFLVKGAEDHTLKLSTELEQIINKYQIPADFFDKKEAWTIPIKGDLDDNIRRMEEKFSKELAAQGVAKSKETELIEDLLEAAKQEQLQLAYTKQKQKAVITEAYINNAGLVILNGYLNYFFQQCGYLNDKRALDPAKANRAAVLLQYVLDPEGLFQEEDMVLNKILCGLPINEILDLDFEATELEQNITEQMLQAIIGHWKMINNSSPEGFRKSWLQRQGKLTKRENEWELLVEKRTFDILLDYKPFTLSPINFEWMASPIKVIWR